MVNNLVKKAGRGGGGSTGFVGSRMQPKSEFISALVGGGKKEVIVDETMTGAAPPPSSSDSFALRETEGIARASKPSEELAATDVPQLSREDCWRLILEAGMQWPSCDMLNFRSQSQGLTIAGKASKNPQTILEQGNLPVADHESKSQGSSEAMQVNQIANRASRILANRALQELARTPPQAASIPCALPSTHSNPYSTRETSNATQQTTRAVVAAAAAATPAAPGVTVAIEPPKPSLPLAASPDPSSRQRFWETNPSSKQTAQLTIFYAGTVKVFHNVTEEKAHLIMLLLGANGASLTSLLAKFLSSQGGSMTVPSILNATTTARSSIQTSPANPPPPPPPPPSASVLNTTSAAPAPDVAPLLASAQAQQQHLSLISQLPVLVNVQESLGGFVHASALESSAEGQSIIISQRTQSQQQQQEGGQVSSNLPQMPIMTADVKQDRSLVTISASAQSTQGNNATGNQSQQELPEGSLSSTPPTPRSKTLIRSNICFSQELPHARKSSLARFFDMRQRQKRARITSQNALTSKKLVGCSPLPSDSALSSLKCSLQLSQPSSPTGTSQAINGKDSAAATNSEKGFKKMPAEQQRVETATTNNEALPMEIETVAVTAVVSS